MRRWAFMLGGLIVWAIHFLGVYAIASIADVVSTADDPAWRAAGLAFSAACVAAAVALLIHAVRVLRRARRDDALVAFAAQIAALGAGLAAVAIVWQGLPTLIGH